MNFRAQKCREQKILLNSYRTAGLWTQPSNLLHESLQSTKIRDLDKRFHFSQSRFPFPWTKPWNQSCYRTTSKWGPSTSCWSLVISLVQMLAVEHYISTVQSTCVYGTLKFCQRFHLKPKTFSKIFHLERTGLSLAPQGTAEVTGIYRIFMHKYWPSSLTSNIAYIIWVNRNH